MNEAKRKVTVKLVPRIDLQAVAEKFVMNFTYRNILAFYLLLRLLVFCYHNLDPNLDGIFLKSSSNVQFVYCNHK